MLPAVVQGPTWMGSVKKPDLQPGYDNRGMETGNPADDPDALGVDAAAGAKVEARPSPANKCPNPGGGASPPWNREMPIDVLAGMRALGTPPKTGAEGGGARAMPKPPVSGAPVRLRAPVDMTDKTAGVAGICGTKPAPPPQ